MTEKTIWTSGQVKIAIIGGGYVGLSLACLLAGEHDVVLCDIDEEKVRLINEGVSPVKDPGIEAFFASGESGINATLDMEEACSSAYIVIIAVPTNFDEEKESFDTSAARKAVLDARACAKDALIVVKSTVPAGFTAGVGKEAGGRVIFCPEFLRENRALYDSRHPERIIAGADLESEESKAAAEAFAAMMKQAAENDPPVMIMDSTEAEAVKLFSNTYLAMRVVFFNELDAFAESRGLDTRRIIDGVCADGRIGPYYNNPSFGYGGYCLPKDTKQLLSDFGSAPQTLIGAVVEGNDVRKESIAERIAALARERSGAERRPACGIYRMTMKAGSDNFRQSAVFDVMDHLRSAGVTVIVHEPLAREGSDFGGADIENDIDVFKEKCDIIIANRADECLDDVREKVYTRDIFGRD